MINEGRCQEFTGGGDRQLYSNVPQDGQGQDGYIEMEELMEALGDDELGPNEQVVKDIIRDVDTDKVSSQNKLIKRFYHLLMYHTIVLPTWIQLNGTIFLSKCSTF